MIDRFTMQAQWKLHPVTIPQGGVKTLIGCKGGYTSTLDEYRPKTTANQAVVTACGANILPLHSDGGMSVFLGEFPRNTPVTIRDFTWTVYDDGSVRVQAENAPGSSGSTFYFYGGIPLESGKTYYTNDPDILVRTAEYDTKTFKDSFTTNSDTSIIMVWFWFPAGTTIDKIYRPMIYQEGTVPVFPYKSNSITLSNGDTDVKRLELYPGTTTLYATGETTLTHLIHR